MAVYLNQAKAKVLAQRRGVTASNSIQITHFCVGTYPQYTPTETQTDLRRRINIGLNNKKEVQSIAYDSANNKNVITCFLSASECPNERITELGLVDSDGDIVCIKTFPEKLKDDQKEMTFYVDDYWR